MVEGLLLVLLGLSVFIAWQLRGHPLDRRGSAAGNGEEVVDTGSTVAVAVAGDPPLLFARPWESDSTEIELVDRELQLPIMRVRPDNQRASGTLNASPLISDAVSFLIQHTPDLLRQLPQLGGGATAQYVVTFPADAQRALASGTGRLMESGARVLPTVVSTSSGKIIAHGTVSGAAAVGGGSGSAIGSGLGGGGAAVAAAPMLPVLAVAAVAVGAIYLVKRDLDRTLGTIDSHVLNILQRLEDDDYGRLEAALVAARHVEAMLDAGDALPQHHRLQLAMANRDVDAVYLSRHRLLQRFEDEHKRIYDHMEREGRDLSKLPPEMATWFGENTHFRKEAALYVAALVARARVEDTVAAVLATDGYPQESLRRSTELLTQLNTHARGFERRMERLSEKRAKGKLSGVTATAGELAGMLNQVTRGLPRAEPQEVTLRVTLQLEAGEGNGGAA